MAEPLLCLFSIQTIDKEFNTRDDVVEMVQSYDCQGAGAWANAELSIAYRTPRPSRAGQGESGAGRENQWSTVLGNRAGLGCCSSPHLTTSATGPLAGPLMGDIDSAWPWIWLRSRNTRHCKKCNESFAESLVPSSIHLIIPLGV